MYLEDRSGWTLLAALSIIALSAALLSRAVAHSIKFSHFVTENNTRVDSDRVQRECAQVMAICGE